MPRIKTYLKDSHPFLETSWDSQKNSTPFSEYATNSHKKVWWICELFHSYDAMIANRVKGQGCSYCSGKKVLPGFNDLKSQRPDLAVEWDLEANEVASHEIHEGSHKKVFWKCTEGHKWAASISNRNSSNNQNGCPTCSGNILLSGFNDLLTLHPELEAKWDFDLNNQDPRMLRKEHKGKAFWKCTKCKKNWSRRPALEARRDTTLCSSCLRGTSLFEKAFINKFTEAFPHVDFDLNNKNIIAPYEIDLYFPALKKAIELNGEYWHSNYNLRKNGHESAESYHRMKVNLAKDKGIDLAFLWEDDWRETPEELMEKIKMFLTSGKLSLELSRLYSKKDYIPTETNKKKKVYEIIEAWTFMWQIEMTQENSPFGQVIVLDQKIALGIYPRASSSRALRKLQEEYKKRSLALFFVYPWDNLPLLLQHMESKLSLATRSYAAKRLKIDFIENKKADAFVNLHHLQGSARGVNKVSIGLYGPKGELLAVQQYSKYRFSTAKGRDSITGSGQWEGLRLCFKPQVKIYGGATRLQRFFENKFKPTTIVSYVNLSHSSGSFKFYQGFTEETNFSQNAYMWVLMGEPKRVIIKDKCGEMRVNNLEKVSANQTLNPNRIAGAFGQGVGRFFYDGVLGSRAELKTHLENGKLTDNDAIMEAIGYKKYFIAGQGRWRKEREHST